MKPYPKYKESSIEWIGQIPEHWEVKKLNTSTAEQPGTSFNFKVGLK